jgi:GNAT superfamily N-acetyltransferase
MTVQRGRLTIRKMTSSDTVFATEMTELEKWGNVRADFERLIVLDPDGCFVGWLDGERVSMISSTRYGDLAFLGSLIVRKACRGQGIGRAMMLHAIEYLKSTGIRTIELDGEMQATPLYRRLGFKEKCLSFRFFRAAESERSNSPGSTPGISDAARFIDDLVAFDRECTGLDRERVLRRFADEFPETGFVVKSDKIAGYAFARPIVSDRYNIGPVVSVDPEATQALLSHLVSRFSSSGLHVGVPQRSPSTVANQRMIEELLYHGFVSRPPSLRMYLGERQDYEKWIAAILSPEKG